MRPVSYACRSLRADEIEEINTTNAEEVAKLENGTKEQEEQHTKEHNAQVESLEKECEKLRTELAEMVESNTTCAFTSIPLRLLGSRTADIAPRARSGTRPT